MKKQKTESMHGYMNNSLLLELHVMVAKDIFGHWLNGDDYCYYDVWSGSDEDF
jgi:hypothetical protein